MHYPQRDLSLPGRQVDRDGEAWRPPQHEAGHRASRLRSWWVLVGGFAIIQLVLLLTTLFESSMGPLLRFDRPGIVQGELWRLVTGHFVHLSAYHALMNIAGLILVYSIFPYALQSKYLLRATLFIGVSISVALWIGSAHLAWYMGFSGVLHGLFAFGLVMHLTSKLSLYWLVLAAMLIKVIHEQLPGYDTNHLLHYLHAPVAVDAHLYGVLTGLIWGGWIRCNAFSGRTADKPVRRD